MSTWTPRRMCSHVPCLCLKRCWSCWRWRGCAASSSRWEHPAPLESPTQWCGTGSTTKPRWCPTYRATASRTPTIWTMSSPSWPHRAWQRTASNLQVGTAAATAARSPSFNHFGPVTNPFIQIHKIRSARYMFQETWARKNLWTKPLIEPPRTCFVFSSSSASPGLSHHENHGVDQGRKIP